MIKDMTDGNPTRLIINFSLPILIGNIFQQLYHISDIIIIGRLLGVDALAAAGASAPIYFTLLLITLGFTAGLCVITAQRFGAKDENGVRRSVTHSTIASMILSLCVTIALIIWLRPILNLMNVPTNIMSETYDFIFALSLGLVMVVAYNLLSGFIRALGDSKTPLYFLIFSSVLNILLNYLFIRVFKMGIAGSAWGTNASMTISVLLCIIYINRKFPILRLSKTDWIFNSAFMKKHLRVAIPMSLQFSVIAISLLIIQSVCNTFGANAIAGFTAALRIEQLSTQPLIALGIALATYSAQNYGAGMIGRIRRGVRNSSFISLGFAVLLALVVRFLGENMIDIFIENPNSEMITTGQAYLNISTLFYFFLGQIFIFRNAIQGMGKITIPIAASVTELILRSFAAIYLAKKIGWLGICYASPIAWVGAASVVFIGYQIIIRQLGKKYIKNRLKWLGHKLRINPKPVEILPEYTPTKQ